MSEGAVNKTLTRTTKDIYTFNVRFFKFCVSCLLKTHDITLHQNSHDKHNTLLVISLRFGLSSSLVWHCFRLISLRVLSLIVPLRLISLLSLWIDSSDAGVASWTTTSIRIISLSHLFPQRVALHVHYYRYTTAILFQHQIRRNLHPHSNIHQ